MGSPGPAISTRVPRGDDAGDYPRCPATGPIQGPINYPPLAPIPEQPDGEHDSLTSTRMTTDKDVDDRW